MDRTCDGCQAELTATVRVSCAECEDYDLCIGCFCHGFESKQHKKTHKYRLLDKYSHPIITADWGGEEEMLLVEGLETCGIGNWQDISDHVGTKTLEECRDHYIKYYLDSPDYPLPARPNFDKAEAEAIRKKRRINPSRKSINVLPPLKQKVAPSHPANHELQGYMPGRMEFEHEAENEAEHIVKDMSFNEDDDQVETDLKLAVMDIYNSRLDVREERRRFIFGRNLIEFKKLQAAERKKSKEERDLIHTARPLARLMTPEDFDSFISTLMAETELRARIAQLQEYRRFGIQTFKQADEYEQEKKQRLQTMLTRSPFAATSDRLSAKQMVQMNSSQTPTAASRKQSLAVGQSDADTSGSAYDRLNLLTVNEQAFCSSLRILPRAYLTIKQAIFKDLEKRGRMKSQSFRSAAVEANKLGRIYEFVTKVYPI